MDREAHRSTPKNEEEIRRGLASRQLFTWQNQTAICTHTQLLATGVEEENLAQSVAIH
jgi:hypothetical protein